MNTPPRHPRTTAVALLLVSLALLPACGINRLGNAPLTGGNAAYGTWTRDPGLDADVNVIGVSETFDNNVLTVQANVRNDGINTCNYEYTFDFYDAEGFQVGALSSNTWRRGQVTPGQTASLTQTAGSPDARRWNLQIRRQIDPRPN